MQDSCRSVKPSLICGRGRETREIRAETGEIRDHVEIPGDSYHDEVVWQRRMGQMVGYMDSSMGSRTGKAVDTRMGNIHMGIHIAGRCFA